MPKNDLDNTRELDEPDEGLRKRAATGDWFEGTSRDLIFKPEDTRAESTDMAKSAADDTTDSPLHAGMVADLDALRNDSRDGTLRDLHLDDASKSLAQEIGNDLEPAAIAPQASDLASVNDWYDGLYDGQPARIRERSNQQIEVLYNFKGEYNNSPHDHVVTQSDGVNVEYWREDGVDRINIREKDMDSDDIDPYSDLPHKGKR